MANTAPTHSTWAYVLWNESMPSCAARRWAGGVGGNGVGGKTEEEEGLRLEEDDVGEGRRWRLGGAARRG
jgi:hypothetical protein